MNVRSVWILGCLAVWITGCGGDSTGPSTGDSTMTALIDGAGWSAEALLANAQYNETDDLLVLTGLNTTSYSIAISLDDVTTTGTYTLTNTFPLRFAVVTTNAGGSWTSTTATGTATVTITSFTDNRVTGTFVFNAEAMGTSSVTGQLAVTNGQFDLALTRLTPP